MKTLLRERVRENVNVKVGLFDKNEIILILQFGWFCREREGDLFLLRLSPIQDMFSVQCEREREREKYIISLQSYLFC